ncbi:hypothetical protein D917_06851 [Trichinella nativa]|uniref:Uncharacterized protein n=1 Tax=Trichinella nativa TaxID=6335 RepID=A0A1Y3ER04_9BILA|nr:hypothetical protein D917_06851 [Trichinella nativa]
MVTDKLTVEFACTFSLVRCLGITARCLVGSLGLFVLCLVIPSTMSTREQASNDEPAEKRARASSDPQENTLTEEFLDRSKSEQGASVNEEGDDVACEELARQAEEARKVEQARLSEKFEKAVKTANSAEKKAKSAEERAKIVVGVAEVANKTVAKADETAAKADEQAKKIFEEAKKAQIEAKKAQIEAKNAQKNAMKAEKDAKKAKRELVKAKMKAEQARAKARNAGMVAKKARAEATKASDKAKKIEEKKISLEKESKQLNNTSNQGTEVRNTEANVEETVVNGNTRQPVSTASVAVPQAARAANVEQPSTSSVFRPAEWNPPERRMQIITDRLFYFSNARIINFVIDDIEFTIHEY